MRRYSCRMDRWEATYLTPESQATATRTVLLEGGVSVCAGSGQSTKMSASFHCGDMRDKDEIVEVCYCLCFVVCCCYCSYCCGWALNGAVVFVGRGLNML